MCVFSTYKRGLIRRFGIGWREFLCFLSENAFSAPPLRFPLRLISPLLVFPPPPAINDARVRARGGWTFNFTIVTERGTRQGLGERGIGLLFHFLRLSVFYTGRLISLQTNAPLKKKRGELWKRSLAAEAISEPKLNLGRERKFSPDPFSFSGGEIRGIFPTPSLSRPVCVRACDRLALSSLSLSVCLLAPKILLLLPPTQIFGVIPELAATFTFSPGLIPINTFYPR